MNYKKDNFKNCRFNPFDRDLMTENADLLMIFPQEWDTELSLEQVAKYIISLYDQHSPLQKISSIEARRRAAEEISGIAGLTYEDSHFVQSISNYLRMFDKTMEYAYLTSLEDAFWEYITRLRQPVTGDKDKDLIGAISAKTKLAEDASQFLEKIKAQRAKFFNDDKLDEAENKIKRWTPEGVSGK
jgi:hypothetical protein